MENIHGDIEKIKSIMLVGDIIVIQGIDPLSLLISNKVKSLVHHAAIIIEKDGILGFIMSTSKEGVCFKTLEEMFKLSNPWFIREWILRLNVPVDTSEINKYAISQIGKKYDTSTVLKLLFNTNVVINENTDQYFCSEIVADCWQHVGIIPEDINVSITTPSDLAEWKLYEDYYQIKGIKKELKYNFREVGTYVLR